MAVRWPGHIKPGRVVEDFVNLMDLGPTFMEAADVAAPTTMTGKSLLPVFESDASGQVDLDRTFVVTGRERHVSVAREGNLPYPQRAIRTKDFLYIHNFAPDRWPAGDPNGLDDPNAELPSFEILEQETYVAYPDMDASPTKAWMVHHRTEAEVQRPFDLGFGKRPQEELYDLRVDTHYMNNLADDPEYTAPKQELHDRLMALLRGQKDPRLAEAPCRFEHEPYMGRDPKREEMQRSARRST